MTNEEGGLKKFEPELPEDEESEEDEQADEKADKEEENDEEQASAEEVVEVPPRFISRWNWFFQWN